MVVTEKKYYTVDSRETLKLLFEHLSEHDIISLDTETTSLNPRKAKIIGWSVSGEEGVGFYIPTWIWNAEKSLLEEQFIENRSAEEISKKLMKSLTGTKLVLHNGSYDTQVIKNYYNVDLIGSIWVDTGMLVHTVQEEGAFGFGTPFGLKSIAIMNQEALGLNIEEAANREQLMLKESIRKNGGSTTKVDFQIYKADLDVLAEYGASDADLTLRICNLYLKILKEEGLEKFFFEEEVMPVYREVTIPMEAYGVDLDMDLLRKTNEEITKDLEENKKAVINSLLVMPEAKRWVITTAYKEHPVSNKGNWAQKFVMLNSIPLPKTGKTEKYALTLKYLNALEDSNKKDFLLTGDENYLDDVEKARVSISLWKESNGGDYINVQSKKQLGEIVFNYMGIKPLTQTDKGQDQFDMEMLETLSKKYPWAENLRIYNKLLKIKSTYIDRFLEGEEDGRYYFYYKQNGTVSGRYGSDAQQLPKPREDEEDAPIVVRYNNLVRAFLIAGKGRKVIDSDYTSLEPHCFASVSGDENLREIFRKNWDFYSTVAIKTEKLEGVSADPADPNFLKKIDPVKRNKAKSYSLGIAYGMEAYALKMTLDTDQKTADKLIKGYLEGFPQLAEWRERSRKQVKEHGFIKNMLGRIRHLPEIKEIYGEYGDNFLDWRFRKELEKKIDRESITKVYRDYRNGLNNCLNFQLQSLAAAIVNRAAVQINRRAKEMGIDAIVQAQVHDQLIINVREDQAEEFAPVVQHLMETTTQLPGVTLKAPPAIADNWKEGH